MTIAIRIAGRTECIRRCMLQWRQFYSSPQENVVVIFFELSVVRTGTFKTGCKCVLYRIQMSYTFSAIWIVLQLAFDNTVDERYAGRSFWRNFLVCFRLRLAIDLRFNNNVSMLKKSRTIRKSQNQIIALCANNYKTRYSRK